MKTCGRILRYAIKLGLPTLLLCSVLWQPVSANSLALAGVQQSAQSSYDYLGWIQPIAGGSLGQGLYTQVFLSYLTYRYQGSQNGISALVRARVPGVSAGLGYAFTLGILQLNVSGSLSYQYFSLQPVVPANGPFKSSLTFVPQVQIHLPLGDGFYASGIGSYAFGQGSYWSRARLGIPLLSVLHFGPEIIPSGGRNYQIRQYGAFVTVALPEAWEVTAEGGLQQQKGLPDVGYAALSVSKTF